MNSNFVGRDTLSPQDVKEIYLKTICPLDVHLMINEPKKQIKNFIMSGALFVTVHYEAFKNKKTLIRTLKRIRKLKALSGLAINPQTEVIEIMPYLSYCDLVLVMSVEPGFSGQKFMESACLKVKKLKQIKDDYGGNYYIEVDGGINPDISNRLKIYGADIVVSGGYVYNSENRHNAIDELR